MYEDSELLAALDMAERLVARIRARYALSGRPAPQDYKSVYVVTGCALPRSSEFGQYQVHDDTPGQHAMKLAINVEMRVIARFVV